MSNIARPRFSEAVTPFGSRGGGPPCAKRKSGNDEKKRGEVRWNSAMSSKLERRRLDTVLRVRVNGPERLLFERGITAVVHEHGLQRRRIAGRRRPSKER